jgi:hypothetical protein
MREITTKVYTFDELSDSAKEKARDWYRALSLDNEYAWENVEEDAKAIGLKITSLDVRRNNEGNFSIGALDTCELIEKNHGEKTETYQTMLRYRDNLKKEFAATEMENATLKDEDAYENSSHEFLHDLLEDYRIMLNKEIEYQYSNEYVDENIRANEYEFTIDGKRS